MEQGRPEAQKGRDFGRDARLLGPGRPILQVRFDFQMHEAVGQGSRHPVGDGPVLVAVAGGDDGPAVGQAIFAKSPVEDELVAGGLNERRGSV